VPLANHRLPWHSRPWGAALKNTFGHALNRGELPYNIFLPVQHFTGLA